MPFSNLAQKLDKIKQQAVAQAVAEVSGTRPAASGELAPAAPTLSQLQQGQSQQDANLEALRIAITGQTVPPPPTGWSMSNNRSARRLDALEPLVETLRVLVQDTRADLLPRLQLAETQVAFNATAIQALEAYEAAALAADAVQNAQLAAQVAQTEANKAAIQANSAQDALLANRTAATEQALATAQANLAAAQAGLATAQAAAQAADAKAQAAKTDAATAINQAAAAQAELAAFKNRFREARIATPAITIQIATPSTVAVTLPAPYADANYSVALGKTSNSLLAVDLSVVNKTATGFTLQLRNTGLASLAVAAGTVDYIALHD